jgi:hypothetical protein
MAPKRFGDIGEVMGMAVFQTSPVHQGVFDAFVKRKRLDILIRGHVLDVDLVFRDPLITAVMTPTDPSGIGTGTDRRTVDPIHLLS